MLVLSRKEGEKIYIGEGASQIVITLCCIDRNVVRLGIEAPRDVPIYREEIRPPQRPDAGMSDHK